MIPAHKAKLKQSLCRPYIAHSANLIAAVVVVVIAQQLFS